MTIITKILNVSILVSIFFVNLSFGSSPSPTHADSMLLMNTYVSAKQAAKLYDSITKNLQNPLLNDRKKELAALLKTYGWHINGRDHNFIFESSSLLNLNASNYFKLYTGSGGGAKQPAVSIMQMRNLDLNSLENTNPAGATEPSTLNPEAVAINAVATFMANRAKEEALSYSIDQVFKIAVEDSSTQVGMIFKTLFPITRKYVIKLKNGGVYYTTDFSIVRQMLENDLKNLPGTLPSIINSGRPQVADFLATAGQAYLTIQNKGNTTDFLNAVWSISWKDTSFKHAAHYLELFSNAFKAPEGEDHVWLNTAELNELNPANLPNNMIEQYFFYGFLLQQLKAENKANDVFDSLINTYATSSDFASLSTYLYNYNQLPNDLSKLVGDFKNRSNPVASTLKDGLTSVADFMNMPPIKDNIHIPENYDTYIQQITTIANDISKDSTYAVVISKIIFYLAQDANINPSDVRKINFFVQLAQLKDEEEFESFLESNAEPIGSSSIKRHSSFNVSLNGYVGVNYGTEYILGSHPSVGSYYGVTAPIGLALTFDGWLTIIGNVLDLGSLVNQRLNNDTTSYSNLTLAQFFTPGVGLAINLKNAPVTFCASWNHINDLRTIKYASGNATTTATGLDVNRFSLSVLIDIPFLTLYNHAK